MISLRRLVDGWNEDKEFLNPETSCKEDAAVGRAFGACAEELSAELTKYERLVKIGELLLEIFDHPTRSVNVFDAEELREALKEVRDE